MKNRSWIRTALPAEIGVGVPPAIMLVLAAWPFNSPPPEVTSTTSNLAVWPVQVAAVWLLVGTVLKIVRARAHDKERETRDSPIDLMGCVDVLHRVVRSWSEEKADLDDLSLRITVHAVLKPEKNPTHLEQVIEYVGCDPEEGKGPGRRISIQSGIIGLAARTHRPLRATWDGQDHEKFIGEMVNKWGFTDKQARSLKADRRSWMAVPINGENENVTLGVVYLDSKLPGLFVNHPELEFLITYGCQGIADFVRRRYH